MHEYSGMYEDIFDVEDYDGDGDYYPDEYSSREELEEDIENMMFPEGRDDGFDIDDFCGIE